MDLISFGQLAETHFEVMADENDRQALELFQNSRAAYHADGKEAKKWAKRWKKPDVESDVKRLMGQVRAPKE